MIKYKTDKSLIKNGMCFLYGINYYLKVGEKCVKINLQNLNNNILFKDIDEDNIKCIFKPNGQILVEKEDNEG